MHTSTLRASSTLRTRAKRRATISFAQNRRVHALWQSAIPSRFIDELPPEHVEVLGRGARLTDLHIVISTTLEEAFQPGA